jgi:hypothetical protein
MPVTIKIHTEEDVIECKKQSIKVCLDGIDMLMKNIRDMLKQIEEIETIDFEKVSEQTE